MKHLLRPSPCGCGQITPRPKPPSARPPRPDMNCPPPAPSPYACQGGYLMQRIIAAGRVHKRRGCYALCLDALPCQAQYPVTVVDVCVRAAPHWEELPCAPSGGLALEVRVPLQARVRDACGHLFSVSSELAEEVCLRPLCPPMDCWRGQPAIQAAVRLAGRPCPCESACPCDTPLEVLIEAYLLSPCATGSPAPACPPEKPWYPQPILYPGCETGGWSPCVK